jgi:hypothetical protein
VKQVLFGEAKDFRRPLGLLLQTQGKESSPSQGDIIQPYSTACMLWYTTKK